jgi:hypothetical protein
VLTADAANAAASQVDLLTVVIHELGHLLGFEHSTHGPMQQSLALGVRSLPELSDPNIVSSAQPVQAAVLLPTRAASVLAPASTLATYHKEVERLGVTFTHVATAQWNRELYDEPTRNPQPMERAGRFQTLHDRSAILDHAISEFKLSGAQGKLLEPWDVLASHGGQYAARSAAGRSANRQNHELVDCTLDSIYTETGSQPVAEGTAADHSNGARRTQLVPSNRAAAAFFLLPFLAGIAELAGKGKETDRYQTLLVESRKRPGTMGS